MCLLSWHLSLGPTGRQAEDGLHRDVEARNVETLEHDLCCVFPGQGLEGVQGECGKVCTRVHCASVYNCVYNKCIQLCTSLWQSFQLIKYGKFARKYFFHMRKFAR